MDRNSRTCIIRATEPQCIIPCHSFTYGPAAPIALFPFEDTGVTRPMIREPLRKTVSTVRMGVCHYWEVPRLTIDGVAGRFECSSRTGASRPYHGRLLP